MAQLQLGALMAVAEFERALIKERTIARLAVVTSTLSEWITAGDDA
jgi:DNA invertase Pin-like site-specific DNA recombinase